MCDETMQGFPMLVRGLSRLSVKILNASSAAEGIATPNVRLDRHLPLGPMSSFCPAITNPWSRATGSTAVSTGIRKERLA